MKTKEELNELREEFENLNEKLRELTEEELDQIVGGDVSSANIVGCPSPEVDRGVLSNLAPQFPGSMNGFVKPSQVLFYFLKIFGGSGNAPGKGK